mgnify:CR=1 FL=1
MNFSALYQDKDLLPDTPISLGFYNRSGLPTVTVERALKVAVEDTIQEEEVKMDEQSEAAIAHIKSTVQNANYVLFFFWYFLNKILHINIAYLHIENFCHFFLNLLFFVG